MITYGVDRELTSLSALHGLATDPNLLAGWVSDAIALQDNESDHLLTGKIVAHSVAPTADKTINVYALSCIKDDPTWPDIFTSAYTGSAGTRTLRSDNLKDSGLIHLWSTFVDAVASREYAIPQTSISAKFDSGFIPDNYALFITHDMGQQVAASGSQLIIKVPDII